MAPKYLRNLTSDYDIRHLKHWLELNPLPEHLKYADLGANETFHVIAADLTKSQEETLLSVLRDNTEAIG